METFRSLWFLLAIAGTLFETGFCLKCYQCTSKSDSNCGESMSGNIKPIDCNAKAIATTLTEISYYVKGAQALVNVFSESGLTCIKTKSITNKDDKNPTIIRGCCYEKMNDKDMCTAIKDKMSDSSLLSDCQTCTGDSCNGSNRIGSNVSLTAMLLPFIAVCYFIRH